MNNNFLLIFAILFVLRLEATSQSAAEATAKIKGLTQKGNLVCQGGIRAPSFAVENQRNMNLQNLFSETVKSSHSHAEKVNTKSLSLETIRSLSKENTAVKINSFIRVTGEITYDNDDDFKPISSVKNTEGKPVVGEKTNFSEINSLSAKAVKPRDYFNNPVLDLGNLEKMSFLQIENIYIDNVRQWKLRKEEDLSELSKSFSNFILENLISQKKDSLEIEKTLDLFEAKSKQNVWDFDNLMFELNFKFLNLLWNNSTAYLKIKDDFYWMEHHNWELAGCNMDSWVNPIRFVVRKNQIKNDKIKITFGIKANLNVQKRIQEIKACDFSLEKFDIKNRNIIEFSNLKVSSR